VIRLPISPNRAVLISTNRLGLDSHGLAFVYTRKPGTPWLVFASSILIPFWHCDRLARRPNRAAILAQIRHALEQTARASAGRLRYDTADRSHMSLRKV
jgi:hypothetical protein